MNASSRVSSGAAPGGGSCFRNAVNPSMGASHKTSMFCDDPETTPSPSHDSARSSWAFTDALSSPPRPTFRSRRLERPQRPRQSPPCGKRFLDRVEQRARDVGVVFLVQFADASRTRDVDFREVVADDVDARKDDAALFQYRPDTRADEPVTIGKFAPFADRTHHEVAAVLALRRDAREC